MPEMKAYINRAVVRGPYGGGNLWVRAAYEELKNLGHEACRPDDFRAVPDVIFLVGLDSDGMGLSAEQAIAYKMYAKPDVKLVLRVNENDARKATNTVDNMWLQASEYVDGTVFVSNWLKDYFMTKGWKCKNNTVIYNGVDRDIFKPNQKLNNGKTNIVAHHWSSNRMKGADIYEYLDAFVGQRPSEYAFTYIGRHECDFKHTNVIKPLFGKALGEELGKHDVYVSASRFDPGPNHCLEPIACEIPIFVHADGGGCVEFAGLDHAYSNWDELQSFLTSDLKHNTAITLPTWRDCIEKYVTFAESIT